MAELNQIPTYWHTCSAAARPIAVRAEVEFPSFYWLAPGDRSSVNLVPQCFAGPPHPFDDKTLDP
jgi:hypothetical protein